MASVRGLHVHDDGLALKQLFLLRLAVFLQRGGFQYRIEHHVRLAVVPADEGDACAAFKGLAVLAGHTDRKHGRMPALTDVFQDEHGKILYHFLREPEPGKRSERKFGQIKSYLFHILKSNYKSYSAKIG